VDIILRCSPLGLVISLYSKTFDRDIDLPT
jgi:hypothetical protein